jgi:hypothetical protein
MKRCALAVISLLSFLVLAAATLPATAATSTPAHATARQAGYSSTDEPVCQSSRALCADMTSNPASGYVGHDEPSVLFKSGLPGSGNNMTYTVTLPKDPKKQPNKTGVGGTTWNFQLRPTFWFGLALCDNQSAPNFTKKCTPDTDRNNLVGTNPAAPNYIGKHPGTAYMELQFYGPGYVPQFTGLGCAAHVYCAAMTIDSALENLNTGAVNTAACNNFLLGGVEPINWAYITKSGKSQAPANPLFTGTVTHPNFKAVDPNLKKDLLMKPGNTVRFHIHDTRAGLQINMVDLTTGQHGSMTASVANGFGHILFTPKSKTCHEAPYAFHPAYSTANPRGNVWTAHTYNVAMSDEIGHFENCLAVNTTTGNCTKPAGPDKTLDTDDTGCVPGSLSTVVKIDGCFAPDEDFDGQSYRLDWPGTNPNVARDRALHPQPVMFTSPTTNGHNYQTAAFETDLPRIEASDSQANPPFCNRMTGANCVNPPHGAQFYPFYSTTVRYGSCIWQEGGKFLPNTTNDFGGSSTTEFGPLLKTVYPTTGFKTEVLIDNFNSGDMPNPCPVK